MQKHISIFLCIIPLLLGCSADKQIDKSIIANTYNVSEDLNIQFYKLDYASFINKQNKKDFQYPILISRADCKYCADTIKTLDEKAKQNNTQISLYLLDSSTIEPENKQKMIDEYAITSVPTFILMDNHAISEVQTGNLSDTVFDTLMKG